MGKMSAKDIIDIIGPERIAAENEMIENPCAAILAMVPTQPVLSAYKMADRLPSIVMTRREKLAAEWAQIAVQYHQRMQDRGEKIPFPEVCFCGGRPHKYKAMINETDSYDCPIVNKKTVEARMKALGEAIYAE